MDTLVLPALTPGYTAVLYKPEEFDGYALIECNSKRTEITILDEKPSSSKIATALKDEDIPSFSIDNDALEAILNSSSTIVEELIIFLSYRQDMTQENVDALIDKIAKLCKIYSPEYIFKVLKNMSFGEFDEFIETDSTLTFFDSISRDVYLEFE